jgi:hypothetical protein
MTDEETRLKRAKRMLMKEIRSPKYKQRIVELKKKYKRKPKHNEVIEE